MKQVRRINSVISRLGWRLVLVVTAAVLGMALITGCGPSGGSVSAQAKHLEQEYPQLVSLGINYVEWLIETYGPDIAALLVAAAAAL
jgi:hypothetical protein